jgi:hypothetical protein
VHDAYGLGYTSLSGYVKRQDLMPRRPEVSESGSMSRHPLFGRPVHPRGTSRSVPVRRGLGRRVPLVFSGYISHSTLRGR